MSFGNAVNIRPPRHGFTLAELLIAGGVMAMILAAMANVFSAVQMSSDYVRGKGQTVQHARVALHRIQSFMNEATATEDFYGFEVFGEVVNGYAYPDTLVVWRPDGDPLNPDGPPLFSEIVVFCPDPNAPNQLLEITDPADTRPVPAFTATGAWATELDNLKNGTTANRVVLTNMLRVGSTALIDGDMSAPRGAVRFDVRVLPTVGEWSQFQAGTSNWADLAWVQGIYSSQTGLRQVWGRVELQLMPADAGTQIDPTGETAIPFFGSGALYYEMTQ